MFFDDYELIERKPKQRAKIGELKALEYPNPVIEYMPDSELLALQPMPLSNWAKAPFTFDVESYPNYFCVSFEHVESAKIISFELSPDTPLDIPKLTWVLNNVLVIGFNSQTYDAAIVSGAVQGLSTHQLYDLTYAIIVDEMRPLDACELFGVKMLKLDHIDLYDVAPLSASLKAYGARMHCERLQELPYPPGTVLTKQQAANTLVYNVNDNRNTTLLYKELKEQIKLRETLSAKYGLDLRSKSDAQIAEFVICNEVKRLTGQKVRKPSIIKDQTFNYTAPDFISFQTPRLQQLLIDIQKAEFALSDGLKPMMPKELENCTIAIGNSVYKIGMGGLHSSESAVSHYANENTLLVDRDVASFYPAIKLICKLFPKHIGDVYLTVYKQIVDMRLHAKKTGDKVTADSLKITINGSFGKLGDAYSRLFSPDLMIQVTITGQLSLLMLIEDMELNGIPVVSGNTDGIVMKCPKAKYDLLNAIIAKWEKKTGFETEETQYISTHNKDVNNYIALKKKYDKVNNVWLDELDEIKTKGDFSYKGSALNSRLSKNPFGYICSYAVQQFITKGIPVEKTIREHENFNDFLYVISVKGGGHKNGYYLGKVVRWYYAEGETGDVRYLMSGNKVPDSDGAKILMQLPKETPKDIDFERYIGIAVDMLFAIGVYKKPGVDVTQNRLF